MTSTLSVVSLYDKATTGDWVVTLTAAEPELGQLVEASLHCIASVIF